MTARTVWRVAGIQPALGDLVVGDGPADGFVEALAVAGVEVSVASTDPAVLEAIETAAERAGVALELVSSVRVEVAP